jgi:hypothetical protein
MLPTLIGLAVLLLAFYALRSTLGSNRAALMRFVRRVAGGAAMALGLWLLSTGRVTPAIAFGLLGYLLIVSGSLTWKGSLSRSTSSIRKASVRTAFLFMTLDHGTGVMTGQVLAGSLAGRDLSSLSRGELARLMRECRAGEPQSRQVLETYLDRTWPEWRQEIASYDGANDRGRGNGTGKGGRAPMTEAEAFEVLGLPKGASIEDIKSAHRNLMKRLHPDQGGSNYLAAKINEAKEILVGKRG